MTTAGDTVRPGHRQEPVTASNQVIVDWLLIALIGLAVQAFWATRLTHPFYMDAYYYTTNGQRLAAGQGFTELIIWQFLDEPAGLPAPSHTYWMPLPSLLAAAGYRLTGEFRGAQAPFWLLAGLLPLLSYVISRRLEGERWQAWTAALLTASGGFYNNYMTQPATFAPFAWAGALCLLALAWHGQNPAAPRRWLVAGLAAGLAHLTRADGLLLLLVAAIIWKDELRTYRRKLQPVISTFSYLLLGYGLVMGGWLIRNWLVLGRPLSTAGAQTLFLTTYDDLFAYGRSFDLAHFLGWGWGNILQSRLQGMWLATQTFVAVGCLIFLTPFVIWAWVALSRSRQWPRLRPLTYYALLLFAAMSLLFTFPGMRGGLFHSSAALWPWFMALAPAGVGLTVDWTARRLSHWQPRRARRLFSALFVGVAFLMSLAVGLSRSPEHPEAIVYGEIGAQLPATAVVMVGNAPAFYYHTGLAAVSVPNEPIEVLLKAASRYQVTHLVLDTDRPAPLAALYEEGGPSPGIEFVMALDGFKVYQLVGLADR